ADFGRQKFQIGFLRRSTERKRRQYQNPMKALNRADERFRNPIGSELAFLIHQPFILRPRVTHPLVVDPKFGSYCPQQNSLLPLPHSMNPTSVQAQPPNVKREIISRNPATLVELGRVPILGDEDVQRAVVKSQAAQPSWAALSFAERGRIILRA